MDYPKIYDNFINLRRALEADLIKSGAYYERHHILPKSLGGDDLSSNLIALKADEHLFAHLLLAKIHGGHMWLAVKAMIDFEPNKKKNSRKLTNKPLRDKYRYVRTKIAKNYSERFSGQNHPNADSKSYTLKNINGYIATGNRTELISITKLSRSAITSLLLGDKYSYNGWFYPNKNPSGRYGPLTGNDSPLADKTIYKFFHVSGEVFEGTQADFQEYTGSSSSPLINDTYKSTMNGWGLSPEACGNWIHGKLYRAQNAANSRGDISGIKNPRAILKTYSFINTKTKEEKKCKRAAMASFLKVNSAQMQGMINGHYQIKNWCLKYFINRETDIGGWNSRGQKITIKKDSDVFTGTRKECADFLSVSHQTISAFVRGRYNTCKGWILIFDK